jgi:hypothetical protein
MKLCILGPEKKTKFHLKLIEKAKERFEKVLYAPLSGVRIEMVDDAFVPYYKTAVLTDFEVVLPLVSKKMVKFGSAVIRALEENETYTPISSAAINYTYNEFLTVMLHKHIKALGHDLPNIYLASSRDALNAVLPKLKYPIRIKTPQKDSKPATFESEAALKSFIDAIELFSQPLLIQELGKEELREMDVLMIGNRIYCLSNGNVIKTSIKVRNFVKETSKFLNTQILQASIIETQRDQVFMESISVNIDLLKFEQTIGKDITSYLLTFMKKSAKEYYERRSLVKFIEWFIDFGKSVIARK